MIEINIPGVPAPQGSKRYVGRGIMIESSKALRPWRAAVSAEAAIVMHGKALLKGPLELEAVFTFPRPKAHFRSNGELKPNSPTKVSTRPDVSKLVRAAEDSLTGIVYNDDAQIASLRAHKVYGAPAGARLLIMEITR